MTVLFLVNGVTAMTAQSNDVSVDVFRKIPGINVYAQMQNEKEREMVSPGSQNESLSPNVPHSQPMGPEQLLEGKLETQPIGK